MSVMIGVPSKGRAELFHKKTYKILKECAVPWRVFVEPQDYESYLRLIPESRIVELKKNDKGLGYSLRKIRRTAIKAGYDFVWKMDDDVNHWYENSRVSPKEDQGTMLEEASDLLDAAEECLGEHLGGISFGGKFFHQDWRPFTHIGKMFETTYIVRAQDWFLPRTLRGYHEEFVASAKLHTLGLITLRCGKFCWNADLSTAEGGLQSFDRKKEQEKYFGVLQRQFPELVKLTEGVDYVQKTGESFKVTDKKKFNKLCSQKLPLSKPLDDKEIEKCLLELQSLE